MLKRGASGKLAEITSKREHTDDHRDSSKEKPRLLMKRQTVAVGNGIINLLSTDSMDGQKSHHTFSNEKLKTLDK